MLCNTTQYGSVFNNNNSTKSSKSSSTRVLRTAKNNRLLGGISMCQIFVLLSFLSGYGIAELKMGVEAFSSTSFITFGPVARFTPPRTTSLDNDKPIESRIFMSSVSIEEEIPPPDEKDEPTSSSSTRTSTQSTSSTNTQPPPKQSIGRWTEKHGNYLLPPPPTSPHHQQPRALLHFLGGAFVGAAPDLTYRYILEKLSDAGFLIVATPYALSFDYISTCDDVIGRFEKIAPMLAERYGPVPVVGVGHSCGSLLQLLITALFPDTPRAANALISYNNKGVGDAVPFFDEVFAPLFVGLASGGGNGTSVLGGLFGGGGGGSGGGEEEYPPSSVDLINFGLRLGRSAVEGNLPSDELLSEIAKKTTPSVLSSILPQEVTIPPFLRDSLQQAIDPLAKAQVDAGVQPILDQSLDMLEQIPLLIDEVANGARDFNPTPATVRAAARRAYRARRTLLIQYADDGIDESEQMETLLLEAETVMRNKRPMVVFDVQRTVLEGDHVTPLLAPPLDLASRAEDLLGEDTSRKSLNYAGADETAEELIRWLEEGNL